MFHLNKQRDQKGEMKMNTKNKFLNKFLMNSILASTLLLQACDSITESFTDKLTPKVGLENAEFYSISSDDQCVKEMSLKKGKLFATDGASEAEVASFATFPHTDQVALNLETDFTDKKSGVSGKVKLVSVTIHEAAQALQREEHFTDAIEQSVLKALLLVESRNATDAIKPCVLFSYSAPVSINKNPLLMGQCPGALFFNGADDCNSALKLLKRAADEASQIVD